MRRVYRALLATRNIFSQFYSQRIPDIWDIHSVVHNAATHAKRVHNPNSNLEWGCFKSDLTCPYQECEVTESSQIKAGIATF